MVKFSTLGNDGVFHFLGGKLPLLTLPPGQKMAFDILSRAKLDSENLMIY